ncbi:MAG: glycosyltransferase, partial [Fischerella sp.]|nr:glycosyltransferase [Fischerella sp.]
MCIRDRATANVFVLPSYNEALPLALLEAMAWGLPVITTDVGGISEFVTPDKNGLLVTPGNIQQISAAIQSLIENESLRLCLGNAARESIAPLNVDNFISSLMKIYYLTLNIKEGF